ncbi:hypothetical protein [Marinoscillum sp. 108]|uniref:hypothetical protein n=1 Tax=Marinoscillum sp. 108 TaxID=2653151 RepID=UPI0012EEF705|nr:hypothetical protein [Marinoscillum sp. 108]VXD16116.1 conserved hypothetical protein [Marinoscillum sp. 108]
MDDFLKKVIDGSEATPPESCLLTFDRNFPKAINIDWSEKEAKFEAIFYQEDIEYIAMFDQQGLLEKYTMYLTPDLLPVAIKTHMDQLGEIMNAVLINEGNQLLYEVIIRDANLKRYVLMVDQLGKVLEERKL